MTETRNFPSRCDVHLPILPFSADATLRLWQTVDVPTPNTVTAQRYHSYTPRSLVADDMAAKGGAQYQRSCIRYPTQRGSGLEDQGGWHNTRAGDNLECLRLGRSEALCMPQLSDYRKP